jgi:phosphatidylinositol alpha-1,6-mannosyltransferase
LLLAERTPPSLGGRESVLREILARQPADRTRLVAPRAPGCGSFDRGVGADVRRRPVWPLAGEGVSRWLRRTHLRWITRGRPPGIVVAFGLGAEAALALEMKRATGVPMLLHLEAPELFAARGSLRRGQERARAVQEALDESEAIVVASRACRLEAYKAGVLPHRIEVIPPGVDLERFRPGPKPEALSRRLRAQGPVLLAVAGRGPAKDPGTLMRALPAIRGPHDGATLVVVGPVDGSWRAEAAARRVESRVRFVGAVPEAELPDWYRVADLFVLAHREDREQGKVAGVEVAFAEALASGLPVVATRAGGVEEIVASDDVGVLVEPEAHAKLAHAASELLREPERLESMRRDARERATAFFSAEATAARFREFLEVVHFRRLGRGRLVHPEEPAAERPAA